jgi:serine kinase of HPr protein (carbohydrate metabolism regulator)
VKFCQKLAFRIVGLVVVIDSRDRSAAELIVANYAAMQIDQGENSDLEYEVRRGNGSQFRLTRQGRKLVTAANEGELLFVLEKELTIELQKIRRELYFIHAAALSLAGQALLIAAPSGTGKSTTAWALLHHGFEYLSDELAPVDLKSLRLEPYPHALCLKKEPPLPYSLPARSVRTSSTLHVPVAQLPNSAISQPTPLSAIFFLEYCPESKIPTARMITKAEAAARLFVNALNPLAHEQDGLAAAALIAQRVPSFHLKSAELGLTCELVKAILENAAIETSRIRSDNTAV